MTTTASPTAEKPSTAWILVVTYTAPIDRIEALLPAHIRYLDRFFASGEFLASGPRVPRSGGVIVASAFDRGRVEAIVAADPFVVSGIATYKVIPFRPTRGPFAAALTGATPFDA